MKEILTRLSNTYGVSGREDSVASKVEKELENVADSVKKDKFGNIIAKKEGKADFSVMLAAHMDEIGLAVEKVDEGRFGYPSKIGGWDPKILPSNPMKSEEGWGLVATSPPELLKDNKKKKPVKANDLFIDGYDLNQGDFLVKDSKVAELGDPNLLAGKSFDDRAGLATLIEIFRRLDEKIEPDLYGVGTVQEEVGLRGAGVAAFKLNPDLAIVIDTALADDIPAEPPHEPIVNLGKGPAITVKDASLIPHPEINQFLIDVAEKNGIPYQLEVLEHGGTDAGRIHITREGIPSSVIGIPTRYLHSPTEVLDLRDLERGVNLIKSVLNEIDRSVFERYIYRS